MATQLGPVRQPAPGRMILRLALALVALAALPALAVPAPVRVLLLGGLNTHEAQPADSEGATTQLVRRILEESGRFAVDVSIDPSAMRPETLKPYDVVVDNWSNYPAPEHPWGSEAEQALMDFVRAGGGFAVIHASTACFPTWAEYRDLIGLYWEEGKANHATFHTFTVKPAPRPHPITRGMKPFEITDELYQRLTLGPRAEVLCTAFSAVEANGTGQDEPMAVVTEVGKGRCFTIVLGHNARAIDADGWRWLFTRGVEWAATDRVTLEEPIDADAALHGIATYTRTDARDRLATVERLVRRAIEEPGRAPALAAKMAAMLAADATPEAKSFLLRQISLIGGPAQGPAVTALLGGASLGHDALQVLRRMDDPAAGAALRKAVTKLRGEHLAGAITALGARRDREAVDLIAEQLGSPNRDAVLAAIGALGRIANHRSAEALTEFLPGARNVLRAPTGEALLSCAGALLAEGDRSTAVAIYEQLRQSDLPVATREGAYTGLLEAGVTVDLLLQGLTSPDRKLSAVAAAKLTGPRAMELARPAAAGLGGFPPDSQVHVLGALARLAEPEFAPAVVPLLTSEHPAVRAAAVRALAELGGAAEVEPLRAALRAAPDDAERALGELALAQALRRATAKDGALPFGLSDITAETVPVQACLLRAVATLGTREAYAILREALGATDGTLRLDALRALRGWPDRQPVGALLERARLAGAGEERETALGTIAEIALRGKAEAGKSASVLASALPLAGTPETKRALLGALGKVPDAEALPAVLEYLGDTDVREDACSAALEIASALPAAARDAAVDALRRVLSAARSGATHESARAQLVRLGVELPVTRSASLTNPGPDLALGATATSPDNLESDGQASGDQSAIDGDPATYWDEVDNQPEYRLRVAFPSPLEVGAIRITGYQQGAYAPRDFEVLCDGQVVLTVSEAVYDSNQFAATFPATRCSVLELRITGYHGLSPAIRELEVFGPAAQ
jgi:uncharacterized protein